MIKANERFSSPKGTTTLNYEIIGFRPGYDEWAELIVITDELVLIRDDDQYFESQDETFCGFDRIILLQPGDVRPSDVIQTEKTVVNFIAMKGPEDWFQDFVLAFDAKKLEVLEACNHENRNRAVADSEQVTSRLGLVRGAE